MLLVPSTTEILAPLYPEGQEYTIGVIDVHVRRRLAILLEQDLISEESALQIMIYDNAELVESLSKQQI